MSAQIWNGKVFNHSTKWVICLWDKEVDSKKVWEGKALAPGRRSPYSLDVDLVKAFDDGVSIGGWQEWWLLGRGAEVSIRSDGALLTIKDVTVTGKLGKVSIEEVKNWSPTIDRSQDVNWGEKLLFG